MSLRVLVLCRHLQTHLETYRAVFERHGIQVDAPPSVQLMKEQQLLPLIPFYDGIVPGDDELTARVLQAASRLKVISKWGVGVDSIDCAAAQRLGIAVYNTPDVFSEEVGDVVLGYLVLLARRLQETDAAVRRGVWHKPQGTSLATRRLGIVGVGSIGRAVARRAQAIGMEVVGFDPAGIDEAFQVEVGIRSVPLETLLEESDYVTLHCPLRPGTRHLIDATAFERMKHGTCLINTARGPLIDERALVAALREGKLAGAALDVYENEPLPSDSPLRHLPDVILGAHNASNTLQAVLRVNERAVRHLLLGLGLGT